MHLSQILPSVFAGLGLSNAHDYLGCGASPSGREILFLIDGLGADAIATYQDQIPVLAAAVNKGVVATSFPTTTATSLATLTTRCHAGDAWNVGLHSACSAKRGTRAQLFEMG